jgi:hypothetical protein
MDELPAHAKAVLRRAQQHDQCHDEDARQRVREGVARAVGAGAVGASVFERSRAEAQPAVSATGSTPFFGLAGKLAATTLFIALIGTGIALRQRAVESREPGDVRASPVVFAPAAQQAEPAPMGTQGAQLPQAAQGELPVAAQPSTAPAREDREARAGQLGSRASARVSARDTLTVEVALLRQLGEAISRRDTAEAQRLLALHRARFPQPALLEERQGFTALLRCMEHSPGALVSSRAFAARYPSSVLTARVLRECEQEGR